MRAVMWTVVAMAALIGPPAAVLVLTGGPEDERTFIGTFSDAEALTPLKDIQPSKNGAAAPRRQEPEHPVALITMPDGARSLTMCLSGAAGVHCHRCDQHTTFVCYEVSPPAGLKSR